MGILRRIENRLEHIFSGGFGRSAHGHVAPIELARKLAKEMDDHRRISVQRVYVPNVYRIYLAPSDRAQFATYEASLRAELAGYLGEHARREGYALITRPKVFIETADELEVGTFGISVAIEEPAPAPGAAPRRTAPDGLPAEFAAGVDDELPPGVSAPSGPADAPVIPAAARGAAPDGVVPLVPPAAAEALAPEAPAPLAPVPDALEEPDADLDAPAAAAAEAEEPPLGSGPPELAPPAEPEAPPEPAPAVAAVDPVPAPVAVPLAEVIPLPRPQRAEAPARTRASRYELAWPGGRIPLDRRAVVVGRSRDCDIVLHDGNVSRRHAELVRGPDGFAVRDLDSTNGTFVNGRRVRESGVRAGDAIVVGTTTLRLERVPAAGG